MSRFPPHLIHPNSRSASYHQDISTDENGDASASPQLAFSSLASHKAHSESSAPYHLQQNINRRTVSGTGPSVIPFNNSVPSLQTLRPQEAKKTIQDWIRTQNYREDELNYRVLSGSLRNTLQLRQNTPSTQTPLAVYPDISRVPTRQAIEELPLAKYKVVHSLSIDDDRGDEEEDASDDDDQQFVDSSAELLADDDSLDLEAPSNLMTLSGTAGLSFSSSGRGIVKVPGPSTDEVTISGDMLATALSGTSKFEDNEASHDNASLDPRVSFLNPFTEYVEVAPPLYGRPLAPEGTALDLTCVEKSLNAFPLAHSPLLSLEKDELKLFAIWDYELKLKGSQGLDVHGAIPGLYAAEEENEGGEKKGFLTKFFRGARSSVESRYAKKNPWYRILALVDGAIYEDSEYSNKENVGREVNNKDMFPMGYTGRLDMEMGISGMQYVDYVPTK